MIRDAESGRRPSERDGDAVLLDPDALRRTLHVLQEDQRAFDAAREIVARGARDLWIGLFDEEAQELSLLWGSDGRHRADLSYFRARGIAEYPYENIESAKLTRFGRSLLRYMDVDAAELPDAGDAFDAGVLGGESPPYSQEFTTGPDGTAIDFEIRTGILGGNTGSNWRPRTRSGHPSIPSCAWCGAMTALRSGKTTTAAMA